MAKSNAREFHDAEMLMPKTDDEGRAIVKIVADNEQGFRYVHEDQMDEEDVLYVEKPAGWDKPGKPAKDAN